MAYKPHNANSLRDGDRIKLFSRDIHVSADGGSNWQAIADVTTVDYSTDDESFTVRYDNEWIKLTPKSKTAILQSKLSIINHRGHFGHELDTKLLPPEIEYKVTYSTGVNREDGQWRFKGLIGAPVGLSLLDWDQTFGEAGVAKDGDNITLNTSLYKGSATRVLNLDPTIALTVPGYRVLINTRLLADIMAEVANATAVYDTFQETDYINVFDKFEATDNLETADRAIMRFDTSAYENPASVVWYVKHDTANDPPSDTYGVWGADISANLDLVSNYGPIRKAYNEHNIGKFVDQGGQWFALSIDTATQYEASASYDLCMMHEDDVQNTLPDPLKSVGYYVPFDTADENDPYLEITLAPGKGKIFSMGARGQNRIFGRGHII